MAFAISISASTSWLSIVCQVHACAGGTTQP